MIDKTGKRKTVMLPQAAEQHWQGLRRWLDSAIVLEWGAIEKSMIVLFFMILLYPSYVLYMQMVLHHPLWHQYLDPVLAQLLLKLNVGVIVGAVALMLAGFRLRHHVITERFFPVVVIFFYAISMCATGYMVGALSPATGVFLLGTPLLGLVLFPRGIILLVTALAAIAVVSLGYAGVIGAIPYAPLFVSGSILDLKTHSTFYFYSQMFFMLPPAVVILVSSDLIFKQWHKRGREVKLLSQVDPLTGLFNRRTINEHLEHLMASSQVDNRLSVLLLDLDYFKRINDTYGHLVGDKALRAVAEVLQSNMRKEDVAGRFGGEEFIAVLSDVGPDIGIAVAERIRERVQALWVLDEAGQAIRVTLSIGIASCRPHGMVSMDRMLVRADRALYQAKQRGRNCVVHYDQIPQLPVTTGANAESHASDLTTPMVRGYDASQTAGLRV